MAEYRPTRPTPTDAQAEEAWAQIKALDVTGEIIADAGDVLFLVLPDRLRSSGVWERMMALAEPAGLIVQAHGGTATLVLPEAQRREGVRDQTLMAGLFVLEEETDVHPQSL